MATITDGDILEVTIPSRVADQHCLSVFHYLVTNTGLGIEEVAAIDAFNLAFNAPGKFCEKYAACLAEDVILDSVVYQWVHTIRYAREERVPIFTNGSVVDAALPPNDGWAVTKRSDRAGRRFVGTLHVPGLPSGWVTNGQLNGVGIAARQALADAVKAVITIAGGGPIYTPVIFNRSAPNLSPTVIATVVQQTSRVMRRRTVGLGI